MRCALEPDINQCEFYDHEGQRCAGGPDQCGMRESEGHFMHPSYVRQPRWYEELRSRKKN